MEYKYLKNNIDHTDIKYMSPKERDILCSELRDKIIKTVACNGGHLASNLGVVELTVALLSVFDPGKDKIVLDVGHQSYAYKLLTGRFDRFDTLRKQGGVSGFPRRSESRFDVFDTGHSSTSISAALGMARARDLNRDDSYVVAVIGDGAMTGGMSYEAINDLGHSRKQMIVILNDNEMSIDKNVGGMSKYLKELRISKGYISAKQNTASFLQKIPLIGNGIIKGIKKIKTFFRFLVNKQPSMFEDLGLVYYGPVDGHDHEALIKALNAVKDIKDPVLLHICTKKGKGYKYAEESPSDYHGVGPFDIDKGVIKAVSASYTHAFSGAVVEVASKNKRVVAISAAMAQGTGLETFSMKFPDRFFDCGIAEEHAVTMAAGMSVSGYIPVVAIYSSFLQRAYDQIIHDVCFMNNHVVFAIDRSGFVGADGHTHNGLLDISYLNSMPGMTVLSPRDYRELKFSMDYAVNRCEGPCAVRYPRGNCPYDAKDFLCDSVDDITRPHLVIDDGSDYALISFGVISAQAYNAVQLLRNKGLKGRLIVLTVIRPIPYSELKPLLSGIKDTFTLEDGYISGGFGENFSSLAEENGITSSVHPIAVRDQMIRAASIQSQYEQAGIDSESVAGYITRKLSI